MKKIQVNFTHWLKDKLTISKVPSRLDDNILTLAQGHFKKKSQSRSWVYPISILASFFLIMFMNHLYLNNNKSNLSLIEAPEMILLYKNIELMADSAKLSELDWKKIEGGE